MSDSDHKKPGNRSQDRAHKRKVCRDCVKEALENGTPVPRRKAPYPGPACHTHHRLKKARRKTTSREQRWQMIYGIDASEYAAIMEEQGNVCALCRRAKGTGRRALSVDHDHKTGVVRGCLCMPCNARVLGWARDEIEFFERCISYLMHPPAVRAIGVRIVPNFEPDDGVRSEFLDEEPEY